MKAIVAERGQVTIPKAIRDRLGIRMHTVLNIEAKDGKLIAVKMDDRDPVSRVLGSLKMKSGTDQLMREWRGGDADRD
jgi:AbrB family looped-hinge helix DNA binding protein